MPCRHLHWGPEEAYAGKATIHVQVRRRDLCQLDGQTGTVNADMPECSLVRVLEVDQAKLSTRQAAGTQRWLVADSGIPPTTTWHHIIPQTTRPRSRISRALGSHRYQLQLPTFAPKRPHLGSDFRPQGTSTQAAPGLGFVRSLNPCGARGPDEASPARLGPSDSHAPANHKVKEASDFGVAGVWVFASLCSQVRQTRLRTGVRRGQGGNAGTAGHELAAGCPPFPLIGHAHAGPAAPRRKDRPPLAAAT